MVQHEYILVMNFTHNTTYLYIQHSTTQKSIVHKLCIQTTKINSSNFLITINNLVVLPSTLTSISSKLPATLLIVKYESAPRGAWDKEAPVTNGKSPTTDAINGEPEKQ